jgi:DNA-binding response OmpR family regulator
VIDLTPREVKILHLLVKHRGKPVTRDALLDYAWGRDYFPDSRALDQQIAVLRKKIEPDPAQPRYIETVRSVGYRTP